MRGDWRNRRDPFRPNRFAEAVEPDYTGHVPGSVRQESELLEQAFRNDPDSIAARDFNLPHPGIQVVAVSFPANITLLGVQYAFELIPRNAKRKEWVISNPSNAGDVTYSFEAPIQGQTGATQGVNIGTNLYNIGLGLRCNASGAAAGVVYNSIWVWCDDTRAKFPIPILGLEYVTTYAGNRT